MAVNKIQEEVDDVYDEEACSVIDSLEQIGSQWRLIVLHDLQETGFITRRLEEDAPVATYYALTEKGTSLCPVFDEIEAWAEEWVQEPIVRTASD